MNYNYLPLPRFHQNTSLLQFEGISQVTARAHHLNVVTATSHSFFNQQGLGLPASSRISSKHFITSVRGDFSGGYVSSLLECCDGNFSFIFSISMDLASSRTAELVKNLSLKQLIFSHTPFHIMKSLRSNSVRKKLTRIQHGCH